MNLIGNAIKFTEQGGIVLTLDLMPNGGQPRRRRIRTRVSLRRPRHRSWRSGQCHRAHLRRVRAGQFRPGAAPWRQRARACHLQAPGRRDGRRDRRGDRARQRRDLHRRSAARRRPPHSKAIGADWPRPRPGAKVLLVLDGAVETSPVCDLLVAVGASGRLRGPARRASAFASKAPPPRGAVHRSVGRSGRHSTMGLSRLLPLTAPWRGRRAMVARRGDGRSGRAQRLARLARAGLQRLSRDGRSDPCRF